MAEQPLQPGDPAPQVEIEDAAGEPLALSALWRERPALLVFLRHYG
jgi:peroxiredoxin